MKQKNLHTPGPWFVRNSIGPNHRHHMNGPAISGGGVVLAGTNGNWPQAEVEANAHLMAAAPDLLAVARESLAWFNRIPRQFAPNADNRTARTTYDTADAIERAIAKAQGLIEVDLPRGKVLTTSQALAAVEEFERNGPPAPAPTVPNVAGFRDALNAAVSAAIERESPDAPGLLAALNLAKEYLA